ncbi:hypothetical protein DFH08DRAFT_833363 [Mycena albidolilacea]|uniref:Uncharacterized protein n=1 Tax=Mycena albidolilacea TaxID=1033008 RepID=A0AAD7AWB5_9AGAR|nr:hypothetical protein DFH08DRAFT_833363 [Mycena albidolilacea]
MLYFLQLQKFEAAVRRESVASVPIRPIQSVTALVLHHHDDLPGSILPQPRKLNDRPRAQRERAQVLVPCSVCWAVYKKDGHRASGGHIRLPNLHLPHARGGGGSMGGPLSPNSPPRARQRRRPQRRRLGRRGRPLPPFLPSAIFDPCTFNATDTLHPGQHSARLGQARGTCERQGEGGQDTALPERQRGLTAESPGQAPSAQRLQACRRRANTADPQAHARCRRAHPDPLPPPAVPPLPPLG